MRKKAQSNIQKAPFDIRWLHRSSEEIQLDDSCVDTVVLTYTLCTIPEWLQALQQMRRVLKPGGKLLFCEHGQAPDGRVQKLQNKINPVWKKMAGGCNLNRPIPRYLQEGGFNIQEIDTKYLPGPKFAGFNYWGIAN